jgi:hypothetical protein
MEPAYRPRCLRLLLWAALAGVLVSLALPGAALAVGTASISGTVTDAESEAGIQNVEVCAIDAAIDEFAECSSTNAAGNYTIGGLAPGSYYVRFWPHETNHARQFYDNAANIEEADEIPVEDSAVTEIDAALGPALQISGRVTSASTSQALEEVEVCALTPSLHFTGCSETNASGEYTIRRLPPGPYYVEFWPRVDFRYITQYWDHASYLSEAETVQGLGGETIANVDGELERGGAFSGTVTDRETGGGLAKSLLCARRASSGEYVRCAFTGSTGAYELPGLPSDSMKVEFSPEREGFEPDGFLTQYWNGKPTLAEGWSFAVSPALKMLGIDAALEPEGHSPPAAAPTATPPAATPLATGVPALPSASSVPIRPKPVHRTARHRCRRGFHRRKVHGKRRCVRVGKRHRHRHRRHRHRA